MGWAAERLELRAPAEPDQGSARSPNYGNLHALTGHFQLSRAVDLEVAGKMQWVPSTAEVEKENSIA